MKRKVTFSTDPTPTCTVFRFSLQLHTKMWDVPLTEALVVAEHVEDALATLPLIAAAVARAPLGHLGAAVADVVWSHDGAWWQKSCGVTV